ncbi:MAG: LysR family transcriptional regulator [Xanthomonadaceae bacterium]|nr:LysR family transcriptional regulator [Xanthomonadaceae bacterium]
MLIDHLNLNHLRIFECVYRTRSMTKAALEMHLTQSGVSQHIKTLEDVLEIKLFDRIKQRIVPTDSAHSLYEKCKAALGEIEGILGEIKGGSDELHGKVSFGVPIEFGNNVVMSILSQFSKDHPGIQFQLKYGFVTEMQELLLKGELDFAFIDEFQTDARIHTESVFEEHLELCVSDAYYKKLGGAVFKESKKAFEDNVAFIDYQPGEPLLRSWFLHHYGTQSVKLDVRVAVMDVQGVARLILSGLGAGILSSYLIDSLESQGNKLHRFKASGTPQKNTISIAYLKGRSQSVAVQNTMKSLLSSIRLSSRK